MKKIQIAYIIISIFFVSSGCSDFLERYPLDKMNDKNYFIKETDFEFYMNGLYEGILRDLNNRPLQLNDGSDDVLASVPHTSLMKHSSSGLAPLSNKNWNDAYDYIRKCNYIINNAYKMTPMTTGANHFLGEGFYCRASKYFELLQEFGGVPYVTTVLTQQSEELYRPRDPRSYVANQIIMDLDSAITKMNWRGEGKATPGRLNKEAALVLKTRVALFEGSWEYYHGAKQTPFQVTGSDGKVFLNQVIEAGDMLIAKRGRSIDKGEAGNEYFNLFNKEDYNTVAGAFLYKIYSLSLDVKHNWGSTSTSGFNCGLTKNAVDSYLMKDGKPEEISSLNIESPIMNDVFKEKDPRLSQTLWYPAMGKFSDYWEGFGLEFSYPGVIQSQQNQPSYSGYRIIKGVNYSASELLLNGGDADDLIFRYEEALVNYAEAKGILGILTQADLNKTVNLFRQRVDMPMMNLNEINSWQVTYSEKDGFDPSAPNILNEIRREKRIEFMVEGLRVMDLKRWAIYDQVFNGWKPLGAYCDEFIKYWNAKGMKPMYKLTLGKNIDEIDGYINPFFKNSDFQKNGGRGFFIDKNRDYLNAIPAEEISLYKDEANIDLKQNPGWF